MIGETLEVRSAAAGVDVDDATLIAGVMEGLEPVAGSEEIFETVDEAILEAAGFEGKPGQVVTLPHPEAKALLLVGLGEEVSFGSIREASGNAIRGVKTNRAVSLLARVDIDEATRAVVEGSLLGGYQFLTYKTDDNGLDVESVDIVGTNDEELAAAVLACEATILARDWVNTPAKDKSPETLAGLIGGEAEEAGVAAEIWDRERIEQ